MAENRFGRRRVLTLLGPTLAALAFIPWALSRRVTREENWQRLRAVLLERRPVRNNPPPLDGGNWLLQPNMAQRERLESLVSIFTYERDRELQYEFVREDGRWFYRLGAADAWIGNSIPENLTLLRAEVNDSWATLERMMREVIKGKKFQDSSSGSALV